MLLTRNQIEGNLRRTAEKGLISLLNQYQLEQLALKYFGVYQDEQLIGYQCPYSGEVITNFNDIVLEHIIPISSNGGTVLFNCIPTSKEVNGSNEKGVQHLLTWWKRKKYYSPEKLDKLLSYIFEAYDIVFEDYTIEEVENSYNDIDLTEEESENKADITTTSKEQSKKLKEQAEKTGIISYYGFINDCIQELKSNGYDTTKYEEKIKEYEKHKIFKEIERYSMFQEILKQVIKTKLDEDNRSELTYMLNINISKLMQSMKELETPEDIYNELLNRINNIENILEQNNIGILSFFEDVKNHEILYKNINQITELDISKLINEINLCVSDKFNKVVEFTIKNKGQLPSRSSKNEEEKVLGRFRDGIQTIKKNGKFNTSLTKKQLEYLHNSEYESLRELYKVILNKAIQNNTTIEYIDEEMQKRIEEFNRKNVNLTLEEEIELEQEYKDVIIIDSQFNEMISFTIKNKGQLPSVSSKNEEEKVLGRFRNSIQVIKKNGKFQISLTKKQLEYLHNSEYESLRELYKVILNKAIKNNTTIEYIDEEMQKRIEEFNVKNVNLTLEEEIELEQEYKDVIIIDSQFNEMISFTIKNKGQLPSMSSKNEEEKVLGYFRDRIQVIQKNGKFQSSLTKKQLEYLHNSEYESLRKIYKVILNKAIQNNTTIEYLDEEMQKRIEEFNRMNVNLTIEEQIKLEQEYKDVIIIDSQFNEMISFVIKNKGQLPSMSSKNEEEKVLGYFRNSIQAIQKNGKFYCSLTKKQLEYLHNSEYDSLRELYKVILNKAIKNNITIEYIDEEMQKRIEEFNRKNVNLTIEEEIELEQEYKDVIIIDSQFNEMINFTIENKGQLPSQTSQKEKEKVLGTFRNGIQTIKKNGKFNTLLTKKQLEYLHNSKYESLRELYKVILNKAIQNNTTIEYIDEEMQKRIEEFNRMNVKLTIEEQIKLEQEYKDVIIIDSQFNEMISFVIKNKGQLPSMSSKNEEEKVLGNFRDRIQVIQKNGKFQSSLTKKQLEYLHNSEYESLRKIYKVILNKAIQNNTTIEYLDEEMQKRIEEFNRMNVNLTIEEQIKLEQEYKDVIIIDSKFNEMISFVIKNKGQLPSVSSKNEEEKVLGKFRYHIKNVAKNGKFACLLTKKQLEYLHNSEYESLREIYDNIINKAYSINYQEYIDIDNELRNKNMKGRAA